ncbi:MAG: hypothetical protein KAG94_01820 [Clostridiales bacterium]|nr:hypothetical protein [Clostridiales bacterium]
MGIICVIFRLCGLIKKAYKGKNNPILKNAPFVLLMVIDDENEPLGRLIAYIDKIIISTIK